MFGAVRRRICRRLKNMSLRAGPEKHATDSDEAVDAHWKAPGPHSLQSTHGKLQRERGIYKPNDLEERRLKKERLKREAGISHDPRSESARVLEKNNSDIGKAAQKTNDERRRRQGAVVPPRALDARWRRRPGTRWRRRSRMEGQHRGAAQPIGEGPGGFSVPSRQPAASRSARAAKTKKHIMHQQQARSAFARSTVHVGNVGAMHF